MARTKKSVREKASTFNKNVLKDDDSGNSLSLATPKVIDRIDVENAKSAAKAAISKDFSMLEVVVTASSSSTLSPSPSPTGSQSSVAKLLHYNSANKCVKCNRYSAREGCTETACLNCCQDIDNCEAHRKPRAQAAFKIQLLEGTTWVQQEVKKIRSKRIPNQSRKLFIREPNFVYQGDTVVIWDIRAFYRNEQWRRTAYEKALDRRYWALVGPQVLTDANALQNGKRRRKQEGNITDQELTDNIDKPIEKNVLRNNRKRFRRIMDKLYRDSLDSP